MAKSGNIMNLDQEFHSFGVSETLRRQAVLVHNHRTGMALDVLDRNAQVELGLTMWAITRCMMARRLWRAPSVSIMGIAIRNKTKALIEHDRILRGEA